MSCRDSVSQVWVVRDLVIAFTKHFDATTLQHNKFDCNSQQNDILHKHAESCVAYCYAGVVMLIYVECRRAKRLTE